LINFKKHHLQAIINYSRLNGVVRAAASKSSMQRALAAALLSAGQTRILNPGSSNDDRAAISIIEKLGAKWKMVDDDMLIESKGVYPVSDEIDCGESGLSIRMFTPIAALGEKEISVKGSGSLTTRPMDFFDSILPQLGVSIQSNNGKLPLKLKGPLHPKNITIPGNLSSQFLTGLLMSYAAVGATDVSIRVKELKSKPYIDLTLAVMKQFGLPIPENRNYEEFYFPGEKLTTGRDIEYKVEGDWSGGAFFLVAGAINGQITVRGLDLMSAQADKAIMNVLSDVNAGVAIEAKGIKMHAAQMRSFVFDATDCPDLFPPLVALAVHCSGQSRISGVSRLAHKESNRGISLQQEFGKMGVKIGLEGDVMTIEGEHRLKGAELYSHHDHRIAMACTVAALKAYGETIIDDAEAVDKSYPSFYDDLKKLGASVSLKH
jgi:3-phosphoshikimate 1-carboxyvinyltransferase